MFQKISKTRLREDFKIVRDCVVVVVVVALETVKPVFLSCSSSLRSTQKGFQKIRKRVLGLLLLLIFLLLLEEGRGSQPGTLLLLLLLGRSHLGVGGLRGVALALGEGSIPVRLFPVVRVVACAQEH